MAIQFGCLGYLVLSGRIVVEGWLLTVELAALVLGIWSVIVMRPGNVSIAPTPRPNARLVTDGPYQWIRHPMYTALLILTTAWLIDVYTPVRLVVWFIFVVNMGVKLTAEERYLNERFEQFAEYSRGTWRVIPFIF